MTHQPTCWIIAGPNGAGKTTFALEYLPEVANCQHFILRILNGGFRAAYVTCSPSLEASPIALDAL
ncbi:hypothetical protein Lepto7375DRAFT_1085 [Leptolyngbya sp. PCC 7375]|nr:hypothetical protein Lepto7375DRAFT_1085 [Leptolyngbya sp. PCC 7375]